MLLLTVKFIYYIYITFTGCSNNPAMSSTSPGVVNLIPLETNGTTPTSAPYAFGDRFLYECADPNVYQLRPMANNVTVCQGNGTFLYDSSPPICEQYGK